MSKPRDPVIAVVNYFKTADLPLAQQALAMAQAILRERTPRKASPKPKSKPHAVETAVTN